MLRYTSGVVCDSGQWKRPPRTSAVPDSADAPVTCAEAKNAAQRPRLPTRESGLYPGDWRPGCSATRSPPRLESFNRGLLRPMASRRGPMRIILEKNANRTTALPRRRPRQRPLPIPDAFERLRRTRRFTPAAGTRSCTGHVRAPIAPTSPRARRARRAIGPPAFLLLHSVRIDPLAVARSHAAAPHTESFA